MITGGIYYHSSDDSLKLGEVVSATGTDSDVFLNPARIACELVHVVYSETLSMADYANFLKRCRQGSLEDVCAVLFTAVLEMAIIFPSVKLAFLR